MALVTWSWWNVPVGAAAVWSTMGRATGSSFHCKRDFLGLAVSLKRRRDMGVCLGDPACFAVTVGVFGKATSFSLPHLTLGFLEAHECLCRGAKSWV